MGVVRKKKEEYICIGIHESIWCVCVCVGGGGGSWRGHGFEDDV